MKKIFGTIMALAAGLMLFSCAGGGSSSGGASYEVPEITITGPENNTCTKGATITLKATSSIKNVNITWYDNELRELSGANWVASLKTSALEITAPSTEGKYTYSAIAQNSDTTDESYSATAQIDITVVGGTVTSELKSISVAGGSVAVGGTIDVDVIATFVEGNSERTESVTSAATLTSGDPSIFTVANGKVTGVKAGSATLNASYNGKTASATITVIDANLTLKNISVSPSSVSGTAGSTENVTVTATWSDNSTTNVTGSATWTSTNSSVASCASGVITLASAGNATLTASYTSGSETKTATCSVTVAAPVVTLKEIKYTLGTTSDLDLAGTSTTTLTVKAVYSDNSEKTVTPTSVSYSTTGILTLADGIVTAKNTGSTTIILSYTESGVTQSVTTSTITVINTGSNEGSGTIGFQF